MFCPYMSTVLINKLLAFHIVCPLDCVMPIIVNIIQITVVFVSEFLLDNTT